MGTHGHRGEHHILGSVSGGYGRDSGREGWGGVMWGEMSGIGDGGMVVTNYLAMNVPMQQSCMVCTCTQESKVQKIKNKQQNEYLHTLKYY